VSQQALLKRVVDALDGLCIQYMVSGSIVSSLQGEPRATHDADLVVDISSEDLPALVRALDDPSLHLDGQSAALAVAQSQMFNLLDSSTGDKVDFWPLTDTAFDRSRFSRRSAVEAMGMRLVVSSPEDTILKKLDWARMCGGSEKQYTDALRVYEVQAGRLDGDYLHRWAGELGVTDTLDRLLEEAEIVE
jgi:hypothetical protein